MTFHSTGITSLSWPVVLHHLSHKERNKLVKIVNGNGVLGKSLTVAHWNMGSKFWERKVVEAEVVALEYKPDIFIVSESNLLNDLPEIERNIPGYKLYLPKTAEVQIVSRLIIFVKETLKVEIKTEFMDVQVAAIWLKVGARGRKPLLIGGIYREHKYLFKIMTQTLNQICSNFIDGQNLLKHG